MDSRLSGNRWILLVSERLGDVIFCTSAISWLKQQRPDASLSVIAPSTAAASALENNPLIEKVWLAPPKKILRELARNFDAVIDLHNSKLTQQYRHTLNLPTFINPRHIPNQHQSRVALQFICKLLATPVPAILPYSLFPDEKHRQKAGQLLAQQGTDFYNDILIGCHMGCNQIVRKRWKLWQKKLENHKSWPVENFIAVAERIQHHYPQTRFVLTGSPSEAKLAHAFVERIPKTIDLLGKTSILELAALMHYCRVYVTGDTGPMHVACAMNVPLVALFGPTNPLETGPYPLQTHHIIIHRPEIQQIQSSEVINALLKHLTAAKHYARETEVA